VARMRGRQTCQEGFRATSKAPWPNWRPRLLSGPSVPGSRIFIPTFSAWSSPRTRQWQEGKYLIQSICKGVIRPVSSLYQRYPAHHDGLSRWLTTGWAPEGITDYFCQPVGNSWVWPRQWAESTTLVRGEVHLGLLDFL